MSDTPETEAHSPWRYSITTSDGATTHFVPADFARKLERERDEAREAFVVATNSCVDAQQRLREMEDQRDFAMSEMERLKRERDEARKDAKRATYDAAQETIKVSTVKSHWIEACRERDEARDVARWLYQHGMATLLEGAHRNEWIKEERQ